MKLTNEIIIAVECIYEPVSEEESDLEKRIRIRVFLEPKNGMLYLPDPGFGLDVDRVVGWRQLHPVHTGHIGT